MIVSLEPDLLQRLSRLDSHGGATVAEDPGADLTAAVRRTAIMRRMFYAAVLAVALYGTATGAVARFGLPWPVAIGGIFALELGGVVFLSNAEVRRRLGEHAALSRLLGATVAGAAATFNLLTHPSGLFGGFFALMSVLGFVAWWLDVENKRRDRLRAQGRLAAATPAYDLVGHWLRHPVITHRARGFAKAYPQLGLYGSLEAALITLRRQRRNAALAEALRTRIRAAVGKDLADIAVLTFDMDEVAGRLRERADYDGLTALLGSELTAEAVLHGRDDPTAAAARAWLTAHRDQLLPLPTAGDDPCAARPRERPRASTDVKELTAAGPAAPYPNGAGPSLLPRNGSRGSVPAIHPGSRHATTVRLNHRDPTYSPAIVDTEPIDTDPVTVRVQGTPAVLDVDGGPVRGLRTKSVELLVYLTMHPHGVAQADIVAAVWPDVPAERAAQRLSTCLANLRSVIRALHESAGPDTDNDTRPEPIINTAGTYRLDPAIVTVDWWPTADASAHTAPTAGEHGAAPWRDAISAALDSLDEHSAYRWIDAIRQRAHRGSDPPDHRGDP